MPTKDSRRSVAAIPQLVLLLCAASWPNPERLWLLVVGLAGGGLLAVFGLRRTRFERTRAGLFYTPPLTSNYVSVARSSSVIHPPREGELKCASWYWSKQARTAKRA